MRSITIMCVLRIVSYEGVMSDLKVIIRRTDAEYIEANYNRLFDKLCEARREKVLRLKSTQAKYTSLMAGLLLQDVAEDVLGIESEDIVIKEGDRGKPYIEGYESFRFNLSHSGEYVMIAICDSDVGVDIERIRERQTMLAKRCFTEDENEYIQDSNERFFEIWTMKEAYLKCKGTGISVPLNSFNVNSNQRCVENSEYKFYLNRIEDYVYAICSRDISDVCITLDEDWKNKS